jgi:hypothetical protein
VEWLSWLNANGDAVAIPTGTPMNLPAYIVPNEATSRVLAVLFALVVFFARVATKFAAPRIQALLILLSIALLLFALARMFMLPQSI